MSAVQNMGHNAVDRFHYFPYVPNALLLWHTLLDQFSQFFKNEFLQANKTNYNQQKWHLPLYLVTLNLCRKLLIVKKIRRLRINGKFGCLETTENQCDVCESTDFKFSTVFSKQELLKIWNLLGLIIDWKVIADWVLSMLTWIWWQLREKKGKFAHRAKKHGPAQSSQ